LVVGIWSEVLKLPAEQISVEGNFFELGGHSLRAMTVISRLHQVFEVRVPLLELFRRPTVRGLAVILIKTVWINENADDQIEADETVLI
jgi:tyrocidine synthetase-3